MKRNWLVVGLLGSLCAGGFAQAQDAASQVVACQGCHHGALSLQGKSAGELIEAIAQLPVSGKPHPPLPVAGDDAAAIQALVEALLGPADKDAARASVP